MSEERRLTFLVSGSSAYADAWDAADRFDEPKRSLIEGAEVKRCGPRGYRHTFREVTLAEARIVLDTLDTCPLADAFNASEPYEHRVHRAVVRDVARLREAIRAAEGDAA